MGERKIEIIIDNNDVHIINKFLESFESKMKIQQNGRIEWPYSFDDDIKKKILSSKIQVEEFSERKDVLLGLIFDAVINLKRKRITGIDSEKLKKELNHHIKNYLDKPKKEFLIVFPIHAQGEALRKKRWFKIFDTKFKIYDWQRIQKLKGWHNFIKDTKSISSVSFRIDKQIVPLMTYFTPLYVSVKARTADEAFQDINYKYEIMRSILNLFLTWGVVTFQAGPPKPLGKIYFPPLYPVFNSNGKYLTLYYNKELSNYQGNSLDRNIVEKFKSFLVSVDRMEDEIQSLFVDSLLKYVHALDTFDWRDSFLSLWQILENLSLSTVEENLKMTEVASRVKNLLCLEDSLEKYLVDGLRETRNKLVHYGKFSKNGLMEVNYLKVVTDRILSNFYLLVDIFPSKKNLLHFFKEGTLPEKELKEHRKDINSILKMREEKNIN